jgi:hypothetical protein
MTSVSKLMRWGCTDVVLYVKRCAEHDSNSKPLQQPTNATSGGMLIIHTKGHLTIRITQNKIKHHPLPSADGLRHRLDRHQRVFGRAETCDVEGFGSGFTDGAPPGLSLQDA